MKNIFLIIVTRSIYLFICILILLNSCNALSKNGLPITKVISSESFDTLDIIFKNYLSEHQFSLMAPHVSERIINKNTFYVNLSTDLKYCYIYDYNKSSFMKFKMPYSQGLDHIYFHNYDSIFVFFEREYVFQNKEKGYNIADFIIMDTSGIAKRGYSFDSIPFIYQGSKDPLIEISAFSFNNNLISNNIMYIPFYVFEPNPTNQFYSNYDFRLMCAYNLSTSKFKMINIKIPTNDLGHFYDKSTFPYSFDFNILNDSIILFSFFHSSDIYKYNINQDTTILYKSFPNFIYNNIIDPKDESISKAVFFAPIYSHNVNLFFRYIFVKPEENNRNFGITQIFDHDMNLIGYNFESVSWTSVSFDNKGNPILSNKNQSYIPYQAEIKETEFIDYKKIEKLNPLREEKKILNKSFKNFEEYFKFLNISKESKIFMIPCDEVCGTCLNYLLTTINDQKLIQTQKIKFIFFNAKNDFYKSIEKTYGKIITENSTLDFSSNINGILKPEDVGKILLIKYEQNKYSVVKATPSNIQQALIDFLK